MANLVDGGERTDFNTGAVREPTTGEGRFDLLPFDVIAELYRRSDKFNPKAAEWFENLYGFMKFNQNPKYLYRNIEIVCDAVGWDLNKMLMEVTKQYEDGAAKYSENNYANGIPLNNYIDHAARHFIKMLSGWGDEPHDRAVVWNLLSAIWVVLHKKSQNNLGEETKINLTTFEEL